MQQKKGRTVRINLLVTVLAAVLGVVAVFVTSPAAEVEFVDPMLEEAIRDTLELSDMDFITTSDLLELEELDAAGYGITDLSGIQACENLVSLTLWYNGVADLTPLSALHGLQYLDLDNNNVEDLSPIADLQNLSMLYVSHNPVANIAPLADLSSLRSLYLDDIDATDWTPVSNLASLLILSVDGNGISDVSPFAPLVLLKVLRLQGNAVLDISPLAAMTGLQRLGLTANQIEDIDVLSTFDNLCMIDLSGNQIANISALAATGLGRDCEDPHLIDLSDNLILDISPLLALDGLEPGDRIDLRGNTAVKRPLAPSTRDVLDELESRGVIVQRLTPLEVGSQAPDFTLPELNSASTATLSSLRPQVVILDFWASWCTYCLETMPELERIARELGEGVVLLGVNLDRDAADAREFLLENPQEQMTALRGTFGESNAVSLLYGDLLTNGIPHTFVIDPNGVIAFSGHPADISEQMIRYLLTQTKTSVAPSSPPLVH